MTLENYRPSVYLIYIKFLPIYYLLCFTLILQNVILIILLFITITYYTHFMYFIYLNKLNKCNSTTRVYILMYSASEWIRLDLWRFIKVLIIIIKGSLSVTQDPLLTECCYYYY